MHKIYYLVLINLLFILDILNLIENYLILQCNRFDYFIISIFICIKMLNILLFFVGFVLMLYDNPINLNLYIIVHCIPRIDCNKSRQSLIPGFKRLFFIWIRGAANG